MKRRRLKDLIGWLLGYGSCRTCGRTMWRLEWSEWVVLPTSRPNIGRIECREHLP